MGLLKDITKMVDAFKGTVAGTFDVSYDTSEFERENEDGTTILDFVPEARVFICGAEVTKDVSSVSVTCGFNGNTCNISLMNPRGRYEITRADLMKKWREDKDILAAYDYIDFERVNPLDTTRLLEKLGGLVMGEAGAAQVRQTLDMAKSVGGLLGGLGDIPRVRGNTRMIFEVKDFSGLTKKSGDVVFDYRDPVYVFFKGRFSPYWYFGFSGVVVGWDDIDEYGNSQSLRIRCEDVTSVWKRSKYTVRGAFFSGARGENRIQNTQTRAQTRIRADEVGENLSDFIKLMVYAADYGKNANNCHISALGRDYSQAIKNMLRPAEYKAAKSELHSKAKIHSKFMTTNGVINAADITYANIRGGPNGLPMSPNIPIYFQFNEIEFPEYSGPNLKPFLDMSVRYWESSHKLPRTLGSSYDGTGWSDNKAIGVCGIHPAMKYEFVDHFNILEGIWKQCYSRKSVLDKLVISPREKIMETLIGSPTEFREKNKSTEKGTQSNLFRPRLFLMMPQKFANRVRSAGVGNFTQMGQVMEEEGSTVYQYLKDKIQAFEYTMYTSPMGDVFLEPEHYDFHPLDFCPKIEARSIIQKSEDVQYRTRKASDPERPYARNDKAYFFNPKANHPFFIMEKDRLRSTQTFNHEHVHTSVIVKGSTVEQGGILEFNDEQLRMATTFLSAAQGMRSMLATNRFCYGLYIADGFEYMNLGGESLSEEVKAQLREEVQEAWRIIVNMVFVELIKNDRVTKIEALVVKFMEAMESSTFSETTCEYYDFVELNRLITAVKTQNQSIDDLTWLVLLEAFPNIYNYAISHESLEFSAFSMLETSYAEAPKSTDSISTPSNTLREILNINSEDSLAYFNMVEQLSTFTLDTVSSGASSTLLEMIQLYFPIALNSDVRIASSFRALLAKIGRLGNTTNQQIASAVTLSDLKKLAEEGHYDPRLDLVRWFGFNPFAPIKNHYIENGREAIDYAKSVFNRLIGRANKIKSDIIGRPEMFLNRTMYFERKDEIGLLTEYTTSYTFGGDFSSNVQLEYIRKNAITYSYTQNMLDEIIGNHGNSFWKKQADRYYLWNKSINSGANFLGNSINRKITGDGTSASKRIGGEVVGGIVTDLVNNIAPVGGLFSSHDQLGHMEYDKRGFEISAEQISYARASSLGIPHRFSSELYTLANTVNERVKELESSQAAVNKIDVEIKATIKELEATIQRRQSYEVTLTNPNLTIRERRQNIAWVTAATDLERRTQSKYVTLMQTLQRKQEIVAYNIHMLYGYPYGMNNSTEIPTNFDVELKARFKTIVLGVSETQTKIERQTGRRTRKPPKEDFQYINQIGLYFELFKMHIQAFGGEVDSWRLDTSSVRNREFQNLGTVPYPIIATTN